jgi:zinc resistance-associated protein
MRRPLIGVLLGAALVATPALAQDARSTRDDPFDRGGRGGLDRFSQQDREAFIDARIAALRAGLKLTADQEKLWPAVEDAIRDLVAQRRDQRREWRDMRRELRDDFPAAIRGMAERQAARAEALRRVADATAPLYATLDESQKRRAAVLLRTLRPGGLMRSDRERRHGFHHGGRHNG